MANINFNRKLVLDAIRTITKSVREDKTNKIMVTIEQNKMEFAIRNNSNMFGFCSIEIENHENMSKFFGLNKNLLIEILSKLDAEKVDMVFEDEKNTVLVKAGNAEFSLLLIKGEAIVLPTFEDEKVLFERTFSEDEYSDMFSKALTAVGTDESRPVFTGVHLQTDGKNMYLEATNTYTLSQVVCSDDSTGIHEFIIPVEMAKIIPNNDIELSCTMKHMQIKFGDFIFVSPFIEGKFPNTQKLIAYKDDGLAVVVNKVKLLSAIDRAMICSEVVGSSPIKMVFLEDELLLEAENKELGSVKEAVKTIKMPNALIGKKIGINGDYVKRVKQFDSVNIVIYINPEALLNPFVIEADDNSRDFYKYVVSPIRINS